MTTDEPLEKVIDYPLTIGDETLKVTALQMGNPNCCVFVDDFKELDWRRLGPIIENHPQFPERTNVIFVRVRDRRGDPVHAGSRQYRRVRGRTTGALPWQ